MRLFSLATLLGGFIFKICFSLSRSIPT
jgi:hypothetical protein